MANLATLLEQAVADHPSRAAVVFGDQTVTYAELDARANRVANLLASRGIGAGHRVAVSCPNVPYFAEVFWGVLKTGAVVVPIDIVDTAQEVAARAKGCRAHFAFEALGSIPIGEVAWAAHRASGGGEREFFLITLDTGFPAALEPPEFYHPSVAEQRDRFRSVEVHDESPAVDGRLHGDLLAEAHNQRPDPDGRWLVLVPFADESGWAQGLVDTVAAGAAVVMIPHANERLVAEVTTRNGVTRQIG